jgi:hypothetical protein
MGNAVLLLLFASSVFVNQALTTSPLPGRSGAASPSAQATLLASIVLSKEHAPSLHLSVRNVDAGPISILTGIKSGNKDYPAANFSFALSFNDEHQTELYCTTCQPEYIAGSIAPYIVTLSPNEAFSFDIPLQDLRDISNLDQILCKTPVEDAHLTVTLTGRQWSPNGSKPGIDNSYWLGTVSSSVPLTCEHN